MKTAREHNRTLRCSVLATLLCASSATRALAQRIAPLPAEDAMNLNSLGASLREFSPDGKWLAYAVTSRHGEAPEQMFLRTGVPEEALGSEIRVINLQTRIERKLTADTEQSWLPVWSPNGAYLAFLSDRDRSGQAKLWLWDVKQDALRKVSNVAVRSAIQLEWTADSAEIVLTVVPADPAEENPAEMETTQRQGLAADSYRATDSTAVVYQSSGSLSESAIRSDPLDKRSTIRDLAVIRIRDGSVKTLVHSQRIGIFHVSETGSRVAFSSPDRFERAGSQQVLHSLSVVDIASGTRTRLVTGLSLDLSGNFSVSPDGSKIAFRTTDKEGKFDIHVVDVANKQVRNLSTFADLPPSVSPGHQQRWYSSTTLFWDDDGRNLYSVTNGAIWRSSLEEGGTKEIVRVPGRLIRQLIGRDWSRLAIDPRDHSTVVIARDEEQKRDELYRIDLETGGVAQLLEREECYTCEAGLRGHLAAISKDGKWIAYSSQDAEHPGDLWLSDVAFEKPSQLTHLNPQIEEYAMGSARLVEWLDCDGHRLRGGIVLPAGYQEGRRYPLVVLVYGGETLSDFTRSFGGFERGVGYMNVQLFATRGYAVLMPDAPQQMGTPMLDLAKTVLPGVNRVIELGIADPAKVGVLGHSYGGYSVLSLLVQTNRFKAAIALNGMGNLVSLYGEMDANGIAFGTSSETGQELVGGSPWEYRERYIENSPFFYLDRVQTPLLLVHGSKDPTFAALLGDEVFVALRRLGKTVEYARYESEAHIFLENRNQLDVCRRMLDWFDRYLKNVSGEKP